MYDHGPPPWEMKYTGNRASHGAQLRSTSATLRSDEVCTLSCLLILAV
jgi:hypothetical protein